MGFESALMLQAAGGGAATVGAYYAAQGQKKALGAQANMAETNARLADLNAQQAELTGQREVQSQRLKTAQIKGAQKAAVAANGLDLGSETAQAIQISTDLLGEVDANTIEANAINAAFGYKTQAVNLRNDALINRATARGINPLLSAGSQALTSASQVAANRYVYNRLKTGTTTGNTPVNTSNGLPWLTSRGA